MKTTPLRTLSVASLFVTATANAALADQPVTLHGAASASQTDTAAILSTRVHAIQEHLAMLLLAIPKVPAAIDQALVRLGSAAEGYHPATIGALIASFIVLGLAARWLFQRIVRNLGDLGSPFAAASADARGRALLLQIIFAVGSVVAFAAGSLGGFLPFEWPPLLSSIVLTALLAALELMLAHSLLEILFRPPRGKAGDARSGSRLLPMEDAVADHFRSRLTLAIGWFLFGHAFVQVLRILEVELSVIALVAYALGLGLLAVGLEMVWRRPAAGSGALAEGPEAEAQNRADTRNRAASWAYSVAFAVLWLLWVASMMRLFWLLAVIAGLPITIEWARKAVRHLFGTQEPTGEAGLASSVIAVGLEYTLRAVLILLAIAILLWAWDLDLQQIVESDSVLTKFFGRTFSVLVILLVADLVWNVTKTLIDTALSQTGDPGDPGSPEGIRRARLRTLLPIIRNVTLLFLATLAILMVLSTIGIEIGPLIASAGVVGVAIGFGAQTVVKDIISGMFYLLDDSFRVGEYIVTGKFKGTVESFSLRSVRLRHHNGPVYTIPFGDLGAVQNLSRDYIVDKFMITVTYDSDLEKARKAIKQAGLELMEDPELSSSILEPLKLQRVDTFGDYGIVLKMKVMTKPGEQFPVRKKAFPLIKRLFDEKGIEFAHWSTDLTNIVPPGSSRQA